MIGFVIAPVRVPVVGFGIRAAVFLTAFITNGPAHAGGRAAGMRRLVLPRCAAVVQALVIMIGFVIAPVRIPVVAVHGINCSVRLTAGCADGFCLTGGRSAGVGGFIVFRCTAVVQALVIMIGFVIAPVRVPVVGFGIRAAVFLTAFITNGPAHAGGRAAGMRRLVLPRCAAVVQALVIMSVFIITPFSIPVVAQGATVFMPALFADGGTIASGCAAGVGFHEKIGVAVPAAGLMVILVYVLIDHIMFGNAAVVMVTLLAMGLASAG